jgi:hypothetical protein
MRQISYAVIGQGLSEYVLGISLVLIVVLVSLSAFAQSQKTFFTGIHNSLMGQSQTAALPSNSNTSLTSEIQPQRKIDKLINNYAPAIHANMSPAIQVAFANYTKTGDMGALIETAGSSGTTSLLLATMVNAATAQLSEGKISRAALDSVIDLSNKGHKLANVQAIVEKTYQNCQGSFACYKNAYEEVDGFTHLVMNLDDMTANTHGYSQGAANMTQEYGGRLGAAHLINKPSAHGNWWMKDFLTQWEVVQGQLGNDPDTKELIDRLSLEIAVVNGTANMAINGWAASNGTAMDVPDNLNASVAKAVSQYNSRQICTTGKGIDQVTFCQS